VRAVADHIEKLFGEHELEAIFVIGETTSHAQHNRALMLVNCNAGGSTVEGQSALRPL
jgi:hypothetical protein